MKLKKARCGAGQNLAFSKSQKAAQDWAAFTASHGSHGRLVFQEIRRRVRAGESSAFEIALPGRHHAQLIPLGEMRDIL
jgi:hypothetical protein